MKWFRRMVWRITKRAWEDNEEFENDASASGKPINRVRRFSEIVSADGSGLNADKMRFHLYKSVGGHILEYGSGLNADKMRFHLYKSVGGHILETSVYNRREDENQHTLYMIKEEEDFAEQVAQAIMMEMMKR